MTVKAAVLGGGTMGHGIAQVLAVAGHDTWVFDVDSHVLEKAMARIRASLDKAVAKGRLDAAGRERAVALLTVTEDLAEACDGAGLVVEAVPERLELKRDVLARAARAAAPGAVLASNTSSLSITRIGEGTGAADRVVGLHFFNPPPVMRLVEVVQGDATSQATVDRSLELVRTMGKDAIVVRDTPGFATSRLGVCLGLEAIRMLEAEVASAADIDRAMELGYNHPMGPLRLTDLVGLDVRLAIAEHLHKELGAVFEPPPLLREMVAQGRLGKKSGEGFYRYD